MYDPDSYDNYSQFQRHDAKELVPYLVASMTPKLGETVLDFGCGTGFNTKNIILPALSEIGSTTSTQVYAVDLSHKMIEFASVRYEHPHVTYMVADVMKDDCEFPCKFDKIFSLHVLHWISDQRKALKSLWNLLKINGEIAFYYISNAAVFNVYEKMSQISTWQSFMTDVKNFIPKSYFSIDPATDMQILMSSVGFHPQEALNCRRKFCFDSFGEMIDSAMAANPFIHRIPEELQEEYKADFCRCFMPLVRLTPTIAKPNAIEVEYSIVMMRAIKL